MAKLSILGAQRVKALTEMLEEKKRQEISQLRTDRAIPSSEKKRLALKQVGALSIYDEVQTKIAEIEELNKAYYELTGSKFKVTEDRLYYNDTKWLDFRDIIDEQGDELEEEINKLKADYADRANRLWLCETLEEAKEIVGIS